MRLWTPPGKGQFLLCNCIWNSVWFAVSAWYRQWTPSHVTFPVFAHTYFCIPLQSYNNKAPCILCIFTGRFWLDLTASWFPILRKKERSSGGGSQSGRWLSSSLDDSLIIFFSIKLRPYHLIYFSCVWSMGIKFWDPLEKEMATHSSILAWKIPWSEEPGGLQFVVSQSQLRLSTHTNKIDKF